MDSWTGVLVRYVGGFCVIGLLDFSLFDELVVAAAWAELFL